MDIDETLKVLRELVMKLDHPDLTPEELRICSDAVVSTFRDLDYWITCYGYLPMPWRQK